MLSSQLLSTAGFAALALAQVKSTICYAPDGITIAQSDFEPCIMVVGIDGMCCATNRTTNADTCQTNGLCRNSDTNTLFRDFCTDPTWTSPNCLPPTTCGAAAGGTDSSFTPLTECTDGTWCCGVGNYTSCCDKKLGFALSPNLVNFVAASPVASTSTVTAALLTMTTISLSTTTVSSTFTGSASVTGSVGSVESEKAVEGVQAGDERVLVGVVGGLLVLACLTAAGGFWAGLKRGRSSAGVGNDGLSCAKWEGKQAGDASSWGGSSNGNGTPVVRAYEMAGYGLGVSELDSRRVR